MDAQIAPTTGCDASASERTQSVRPPAAAACVVDSTRADRYVADRARRIVRAAFDSLAHVARAHALQIRPRRRRHPAAAGWRRVSTHYAIVRVLDFSRPSVHAPQSDEAASCTRGCAVPCPHIWRWSQRHRTVSSDNRNAALHKPFSDSTDTSLDCGRAAGEDRRRYRRIQTRASMCTKWTNRH